MTNPENIKQILLSEIEKMSQRREDFCKHPGIDFTRDRKIPFHTLLHFQISMESGSVNHELLKYFNFDAQTPSLCMTCSIRFIPTQSSSPCAKEMSSLHYMS